MEEIWEKVSRLYRMNSKYEIICEVNIDDGYEVSTKGNLCVLGKLRRGSVDRNGYICDFLRGRDGNFYRFKRHQIVMQTFKMDEYFPGYTIDHIVRSSVLDNSLNNLRWASISTQVENRENKAYKYKKVICENDGKIFCSCQEAEKWYGIPKNMLSRVARGERKTVHDLSFKYL